MEIDDSEQREKNEMFESILKQCSSENTLLGDRFSDKNDLVSFLTSTSKSLECYDWAELLHWFDNQEKLYYYFDNQADTEHRIYKLAYSGIWVSKEVYDYVKLGYPAIYLFIKQEKVPIGSNFGISQTHGAKDTIYSGIPVRKEDIQEKDFDAIIKSILPAKGTKLYKDDLSEILKKAHKGQELFYATAESNISGETYIKIVERYKDQINKHFTKGELTPLTAAVLQNQPDKIDILVKEGANLEEKNIYGWTALMSAVMRGNNEIINKLIKYGADVNAKDPNGASVLMVSLSYLNIDTIKSLLRAGANVYTKANDGKTVFDYVKGNSDVESLLNTYR